MGFQGASSLIAGSQYCGFACCLFFYQRWLRSGLSLASRWKVGTLGYWDAWMLGPLAVAHWLMVLVTLLLPLSSNQSLHNMEQGARRTWSVSQSQQARTKPGRTEQNVSSSPVHSGANENENLCHCAWFAYRASRRVLDIWLNESLSSAQEAHKLAPAFHGK